MGQVAALNRAIPISVGVHVCAGALLLWLAGSEVSRFTAPETAFEFLTVAGDPEMQVAEPMVGEPASGRPTGQANARVSTRPGHAPALVLAAAPEQTVAKPQSNEDDALAPITGSVVGASGLGDIGQAGLGGLGGAGGVGGNGDGVLIVPRVGRLEPSSLPLAPSKARKAVLIYPSRHRKDRSDKLFVVRVRVDAQGYVDGVTLVRGQDQHSNGKAVDAVWRFRYDPARDNDGHKIASTVVQRFMLNW